jgi:hypothetical protein
MLFVSEVTGNSVELARKQPLPVQAPWNRRAELSLTDLSGIAARIYGSRMNIFAIYGDRDFGYFLQKTLTGKYRYLYYASPKRVLKGPLRDSEIGAMTTALTDCKNRGSSHLNTHWADRLSLQLRRAAVKAQGGSAAEDLDSAYDQALRSPKLTGAVVTSYGDDDRGILIESTPEGYGAVFYREGHRLILSSLRFATMESAALGALTTTGIVYGDWLKANRKTLWVKRLKADAKAH